MIGRSIRTTVYVYVVAAALLALAVATAWMYSRAHAEIDALQDAALESAARLILRQAGHEFSESYHDEDAPMQIGGQVAQDSLLMFQIWAADGTLRYRSSPTVPYQALAPAMPTFGQTTLEGRVWRTVTLVDSETGIRLVLAEPEALRVVPAVRAVRMIWLPALVIMVAALAAIALGVSRSLRPLDELTVSLARQSGMDVPIVAGRHLPRELLPVLDAYNRRVRQVREGWERERHYTADVAHELRTPLSIIATHLALLERSGSQADRQPSLDAIRGAVQRAASVVDQLLLLARLDAGVELPASRIEVNAVIRGVLADLDATAGERRIVLELEVSAPVYVHSDPALLAVAVRNLVANAVQYAHASSTVRVRVIVSGDRAAVYVEDEGPGLSPDRRVYLFDRFARGDSSAGTGAGLGLPLAREIARRYGGDVQLQDRADGRPGLRAVLSLPVA